MSRILVLAACLIFAGCAASYVSNPEPVATAANITAANADGASPAEAESQPALTAVREVEAGSIPDRPKCRKEIPTGSRITIRRCGGYGESEVDAIIQDDLLREQMDREARRHASQRRRMPNDIL